MAVTTAPAPSMENILENVADLHAKIGGRRFESSDMFGAAPEVAEAFTRAYVGNFDFMADMQYALRRFNHLTPGQAKGALNVAVAEIKRRAPKTADAGDVLGPVDLNTGIFRVIGYAPAINVAVRIKKATDEQCERWGVDKGSFKFGFYAGGDTDTNYVWMGVVTGNRIVRRWAFRTDDYNPRYVALLRDRRAMVEPALRHLAASADTQHDCGLAYSMEAGECYRCGKTLVVEASICQGIGPRCKRIVAGGR